MLIIKNHPAVAAEAGWYVVPYPVVIVMLGQEQNAGPCHPPSLAGPQRSAAWPEHAVQAYETFTAAVKNGSSMITKDPDPRKPRILRDHEKGTPGPSAARERLQMGFVSGAVGDGVTNPVGDQRRALGAVPVVPGPRQVADVLAVQPGHQRVDVSVRAVVLADLARDDRHSGRDRGDLAGPAGQRAARVEVVRVPGGGQVVVGIRGLV